MPRASQQPTDEWSQLRLLVRSPEQETYELLRPIVLFGQPASARVRETGVPERTLRRKAARFAEQGMRSLFPGLAPPAPDRRRLPPATRVAWTVMMAAMMFPAAAPMLLLFRRSKFGHPLPHCSTARSGTGPRS